MVWGGTVTRLSGWSPAGKVEKGERWTVEELAAKKADLLGPDGGKIPRPAAVHGGPVPQRGRVPRR
jgi:hypothetical protein